ncbi:hypothetical protein [Endozoicomonas sp.]|uniref:hypothetical protein n=1 Tax=Endozoicomonas sp. TaxID=1892382 RepID=UPI003AF4BB8F
MEQQTYSNYEISTLEQAELVIRRKGIVHDEKVEGHQLLKLCGFAKIDNTSIKRQIEKHGFVEGKDFMPLMAESSGGRPKTVYHFLLNAANHILLSAMTEEGKKARQEAIDDKLKKQRLKQNSVPVFNEQLTPQALLEANIATSLKAIAFAEAMGFTGNQKLLSADRLLKSQIGFSPLEAMEQTSLLAPAQTMTFTPTQLGLMLSPPLNPRQVNRLLEAAGLQVKLEN